MVLYSPAHIALLEAAGRFPKRVRLGPGRLGWLDEEVDHWLRDRIAERDTPPLLMELLWAGGNRRPFFVTCRHLVRIAQPALIAPYSVLS
jgi:prophage regulatory protein